MRPALLSAVLALVTAACNGASPEPMPIPASPETVNTSAIPPLPNASGPAKTNRPRCIAKMADTPAPIPPPASDAACPRDPDNTAPLATSEVGFPDATPTLEIQAEIAKTPDDIERGLMYRRSMSDGAGMLFKLGERRVHTFWMHNTCIPLDMMFVEADGLIVGIVEGAAPITESIRSVGCASSYVLEVNGGWSRKHGVKPGQRITIPIAAR